MKRTLLAIALLINSTIFFGQGVGINEDGSMPASGAMLDIKSTSGGLLIPRMTEAQRDAITPDTQSMLVYQTNNDSGFYFYDGAGWTPFLIGGASANSGWATKGNAGTTVGTHFLGTTDAEDMAIYTNNTERVRVGQNGNVGIGTTTPGSKLQVYGPSTGSDTWISMGPTSAGAGGDGLNMGYAPNSYGQGISFINAHSATAGNGALALFVNAGEKMRILNSGNVGIGTTGPVGTLDMVNTNGRFIFSTGGSFLMERKNSGNVVIIRNTDNSSTSNLSDLIFERGTGIGADASITTQSDLSNGIALLGFVTGGAVRMGIQKGGNVGIGTQTPSHLLHVAGIARSTQTTWAISSDKRVKTNINDLKEGLDIVMKIRPVEFEYTKKYQKFNTGYSGIKRGFIAQEVKEIMPDMVTIMEEKIGDNTIKDFHLLNNSDFTPILIKAVQQQQQIIEELKIENAQKIDRSELDELKAEMEKLKAILDQTAKQ